MQAPVQSRACVRINQAVSLAVRFLEFLIMFVQVSYILR